MQITIDTDKVKEKLKENPTQAMLACGALLAGAANLINAASQSRSRKAFARQVDYRIRRGK